MNGDAISNEHDNLGNAYPVFWIFDEFLNTLLETPVVIPDLNTLNG